MKTCAWALLVAIAAACGKDKGQEPGCEYQDFAGTCDLGAVKLAPHADQETVVTATWIYQKEVRLKWETVVPNEQVPAWRDHLDKHQHVACKGRIRTKGSCTPWEGTAEVPPLPTE